ncbi:helix-turn-helix domain-containing protein [Blautia marasmi]|uniref:helix-turn-helix domain-containing protein n=1 Tax=Blautia marasmi TaxID=1917868 RepID=UPI00399FBE19
MAKGKYDKWLKPEGLLLLEGWARDGLTDEQISNNIGISRSTLAEWKKKYEDIADTLKKGKEVVDYQVENALLRNAIKGDTTAQIFWLKNRRPDKWRDKRDLEHSGGINVQNQYENMTEEELIELTKKYEKINSS